MPSTMTYPGVYIEAVPSGVRTITGVSTSVAAFVDSFTRGPINRAVRVFSFGDFEREFGGLNSSSEASYGVQQFFLNGGSRAWVVRTASGHFAPATITLRADDKASDILSATAGRQIHGVSSDDPGEWGNRLRVEIDYNTSDTASAELFNLKVSEVTVENGQQVELRSESYRDVTMRDGAGNYVLDNVNDSSTLIQLTRLSTTSDVTRPAATGLLGGDASGAELKPGDAFEIIVNGGVPKTAALSITTAVTALADIARTLQAAIRGVDPSDPILAGATVQLAGSRLHVAAGRGGAAFDSETIIELADSSGAPISGTALDSASAVANLQQYALGSTTNVGAQGGGVVGTDGGPPDATALQGSRRPDTSGMYALDEVDSFNILCLPRAAELYESDRNQAAVVIGAAESYCEERRAFLIVDLPPSVNNVEDATDWLDDIATLRHRNAAAYFPRLLIPDPLNEHRLRSVGASGTVAGIYARTDTARGVWKAPAGLDGIMRNVPDLEYRLSGQENGIINPLGLNALRNFDSRGIVVWGARTLKGVDNQPSEWKYVPVRRTALFIEESLYRGTEWAAFEANDEQLWSQLRLNIGAFMQRLFRQGTFQGTTPREAYFVKIDSETTTPADINLGIVNIHVGFAPLKPAEFLIIKIEQQAGRSEV